MLHYRLRPVVATRREARIEKRVLPNQGPWIALCVASSFGAVPEDSSELREACWIATPVHLNRDVLVTSALLEVREGSAGAEVGVIAQNAVPDVRLMGCLGLVEQYRTFNLGRMANNTVSAGHDRSAHEARRS